MHPHHMARALLDAPAFALGASFGIGSALAADLPVYAKATAVVATPVYNWTGLYIGGTVGGA